jgi:pyridoxamine 5'-phosphate oxidase
VTALRRSDLDPDPLRQLDRWRSEAADAGVDTSVVVLATAAADGQPSARMVLVKGLDDGIFRFFTNYESRKAAELAGNPLAALLFHWPGRQARIEGVAWPRRRVRHLLRFETTRQPPERGGLAAEPPGGVTRRPRGGRRAHARAVPRRRRPRPETWGGYRLDPHTYEFWQHDQHRMHDRFRYTSADGAWAVARLGP